MSDFWVVTLNQLVYIPRSTHVFHCRLILCAPIKIVSEEARVWPRGNGQKTKLHEDGNRPQHEDEFLFPKVQGATADRSTEY